MEWMGWNERDTILLCGVGECLCSGWGGVRGIQSCYVEWESVYAVDGVE